MTDGTTDTGIADFTDAAFGLSDDVVRGIYAHGFERPSPIQVQTVPAIMASRDVVAQARSGTGKTAAFGIAAAEIALRAGGCAVLVLCHTRELAFQTAETLRALAQYTGVRVGMCCGGGPVESGGIVVGTPGKVAAARRGRRAALSLGDVRLLVLDEVDEMLRDAAGNSLREQVREVMVALPPDARLALFSATMPEPVRQTVREFLQDPLEILLPSVEVPLSGIAQYRVRCDEASKHAHLHAALQRFSAPQTMVFASTRERAQELSDVLRGEGLCADCVHGAMEQRERAAAMARFVAGDTSILVSTNVLARGIDVQQVGLVVLYDVTECSETYMHCIGRSGRYGRQGVAVALCGYEADEAFLRSCEALYEVCIRPLE